MLASFGTSQESSAAGAGAATARTAATAAGTARRRIMSSPESWWSDVVEPASSLRDRATHRWVHGKGLGKLVGGQRLRDRDRDRVDQLAGARSDDDAADHDA